MLFDEDGKRGRRQGDRGAYWIAATVVAALFAGPAVAGPASETADTMHVIGVAMAAYLTDQVGEQPLLGRGGPPQGPSSGAFCSPTHEVDLTSIPVISHAALEALLVPLYIASVPAVDAWGNPFEFRLGSGLQRNNLAVRSPGRDTVFEGTAYTGGTITDPDDDQVWVDGVFVRVWPAAHETARQARARFEMVRVGAAWLSWLVDQVGEGATGASNASVRGAEGTFDVTTLPIISHTDLLDDLVRPGEAFAYTECLPERDPWGHLYEYRLSANLLASNVLLIRTPGRDGVYEGDVYDAGTATPPGDFDRDIVWHDGFFLQFPDGDPALVFGDGFELGDAWPAWSCTVPTL